LVISNPKDVLNQGEVLPGVVQHPLNVKFSVE